MRWRTYSDQFRDIRVVYPSLNEQQEIVNYLDEKCSAIDNLIAKKEQYLSEIENYKKREEDQMGNELILPENYKQTYDKIVKMIETAKYKVFVTKALHGEVFPIG